ncbi:hypothetical protein HGRIS_012200 [Hohenbuehelia grisea]|uniref:PCI domain-containing protein n=1 Tax=Hohenbuehelia grisea TaxID=104357 RepID=A0ABR3IRI5_9AGAR
MDVDIPDQISALISQLPQGTGKRTHRTVPVDASHPFELETYIANYTGRGAIDRLIHIITSAPSIAPEAFNVVVQHIQQTRDPSLYQHALNAYEEVAAHAQLPPPSDLATLDTRWADEMIASNQIERQKLETEVKTYMNNLIKESIRMGLRDLGDFYRSIGEHGGALKQYTRSREFCTTSQHVLDMCLSVLELLIEHRNYSHIATYVFKADAAIDAASSAAQASGATGAPTSSKKGSAERDKVQSKLDFATGLSSLGQAHYEKAAMCFLRLGPPHQLGDWLGKLVAPGDIAIYGALCSLASLSRSAIKAQVIDNPTFASYIEHEPYIRELIEAYMSSNFKVALDLLSKFSTRHFLDINLAPHLHDLTNLIRDRAVVLYFQPFSSIKLERMGASFGWSLGEVERHVVRLIQSGDIKGRVDSQNKVLQAKQTDHRTELFARASKAGKDIQNSNRKLLLRMRLQQADLVVKAPKGSHAQPTTERHTPE